MPSFKLPSGGIFGGSVKVVGKELVEAKLLKAKANILANNYAMVKEMLTYVEAEVVPNIPTGPGHFGYHLRDTFKAEVREAGGQMGTMVKGVLKAAVQGYWREYGTQARYRGPNRKAAGVRLMTGQAGTGGERAFLTAHHALNGVKRFITAYYGGMARWWRA